MNDDPMPWYIELNLGEYVIWAIEIQDGLSSVGNTFESCKLNGVEEL